MDKLNMIKNSKFQQVCQRIILEQQIIPNQNIISENLGQKIKNFMGMDFSHPFKTTSFPTKAVKSFVRRSGMFRLDEKTYICYLFNDDDINDVVAFENELESDIDKITQEQYKEKYNKLMKNINGYYFTIKLPKSISGDPKVIKEGIFGSNIKFTLINGKTNKTKTWNYDIYYKTTTTDMIDYIESKIEPYGLELNSNIPYPSDIRQYPNILLFGFGEVNVKNVIEQFKRFGISLQLNKNEFDCYTLNRVEKSYETKTKEKKSSISKPTDKSNLMSWSEIQALQHNYKFSKKGNLFEKNQKDYTIRFKLRDIDLSLKKLNHPIEFEASNKDGVLIEFGFIGDKDKTVEDIVNKINENIQDKFDDSNFELQEF